MHPYMDRNNGNSVPVGGGMYNQEEYEFYPSEMSGPDYGNCVPNVNRPVPVGPPNERHMDYRPYRQDSYRW